MFEEAGFALSFGSDNHSGVHPKILATLAAANQSHCHSYGMDPISDLALGEFRRLFGPQVHAAYVFNGTAANVIGLKLCLQDFESAVVSDISHLNTDECAAPENAGIKLLPVASQNGKITVDGIKKYLVRRGDQHYAQPRLLSLTQPTELGTLYSYEEFRDIISFAKSQKLCVHIDGTRLIHASHRLNKSLYDLTFGLGVDIVSFGGTKNGLLGAEAVLFENPALKERLKYLRKQMLHLPSKTRFLAAQYLAYLKDDLWREIAQHSCEMTDFFAEQLRQFPEVEVVYPVQSNALFVKVPPAWVKPLREKTFFYVWDEQTSVLRWMLSFDVTKSQVESFLQTLKELRRP